MDGDRSGLKWFVAEAVGRGDEWQKITGVGSLTWRWGCRLRVGDYVSDILTER